MRDVVLEVGIGREMLRQVGREQRLDRAGQPPEVSHLDQQPVARPQSAGGDEDRDVAQLKGERVGERDAGLAPCEEKKPPAEFVDEQDHREPQQPRPRPAPRGDDEHTCRDGDHGQRDDVLGGQQIVHVQPAPGSSHSGVTPKRAKRARRSANHRYAKSSRTASGGKPRMNPSAAQPPPAAPQHRVDGLRACRPPPAGGDHPDVLIRLRPSQTVALERARRLVGNRHHAAAPRPARQPRADAAGPVENEDQVRLGVRARDADTLAKRWTAPAQPEEAEQGHQKQGDDQDRPDVGADRIVRPHGERVRDPRHEQDAPQREVDDGHGAEHLTASTRHGGALLERKEKEAPPEAAPPCEM